MLIFLILFGILFGLTAPFAVRAWRSRSIVPLKEAGWGAVAGIAAGLIWGVGARVAMRIVAVADGLSSEFSVGGTVLILFVGGFFGLPLGLLFAAVRRWLPGSALGKGVAFGSILALLLLIPLAGLGASDLDRGPADAPVLIGVGLFSGLFILHGVLMEAIIRWRRPFASARAASSSRLSSAGRVADLSGSQT